jgi:protein-disulfide isomerase
MYAALFDNQDRISPAVIDELAKGLGLDMAKFQKDSESEAVADAVSRDRKQGERLDIQSTPTLYINGRMFPPSPDFAEDLEDWITLEAELTGGAAPVAAPAPAVSVVAPAPVHSAAPAGSVTKKP